MIGPPYRRAILILKVILNIASLIVILILTSFLKKAVDFIWVNPLAVYFLVFLQLEPVPHTQIYCLKVDIKIASANMMNLYV